MVQVPSRARTFAVSSRWIRIAESPTFWHCCRERSRHGPPRCEHCCSTSSRVLCRLVCLRAVLARACRRIGPRQAASDTAQCLMAMAVTAFVRCRPRLVGTLLRLFTVPSGAPARVLLPAESSWASQRGSEIQLSACTFLLQPHSAALAAATPQTQGRRLAPPSSPSAPLCASTPLDAHQMGVLKVHR